MATLREIVQDPAKRQQVIEDALKVIDAEVADKGGLGGVAIKAAYSMAKGVAPGVIQRSLGNMLDEFMGALQPFFDQSKAKGTDFKAFLVNQGAVAADALLGVTDARAARASAGALKKGYEKLRPTAQKHVEAALPRLADLVTKYAG
jgi:hypothetical protein